MDVNKATYFTVIFFSSLLFVKKRNTAPIVGSKISDERIGKFINKLLKKLIMLKNLAT